MDLYWVVVVDALHLTVWTCEMGKCIGLMLLDS